MNRFILTPITFILLFATFLLITVPSIIYGFCGYFLLPLGFLLSLFVGRPSAVRASLIAVKLIPVFLIACIPLIFYFFVNELVSYIFLAWMIFYFISRRYTGAAKKCAEVDKAWKELLSDEVKESSAYIKNHPIFMAIVLSLNVIALLVGYLIDELNGLYIGLIIAAIIWIVSPYARETIVKDKSTDV